MCLRASGHQHMEMLSMRSRLNATATKGFARGFKSGPKRGGFGVLTAHLSRVWRDRTKSVKCKQPFRKQPFTGSKKELLAPLKKVDPTGFAPQHLPELRIAPHNIAFTQTPALKATLRRASSNESLSKQSGDQDLPTSLHRL